INTTLSNISFVKQDANYLNNLNSKDIQLYPNPATAKNFTCSFYSNADAQELTLKVTDVMGRTISTKQVNAVKGLNIVPVSLNTNINGIHIVSLDGAGVKYNSKKIVLTY
ncbi:MAG: T9SS type A sorting domain-containing protein, partial [Bacteroidota bacterium]|nr:T9SS type A sorting domain-containing protein [Bacteroidota bacterium]